jgi:hypothetical protein
MISKVQEELKVDQNIEVSVRLATSPEEILKEGAEPFINLLLKGISVGLRINVWRKISDVFFKIIEEGEIESKMLPIFGALAPAFLLRLQGILNIGIDDHMMQKLQEHPLLQPLLMDAGSLIAATSNVSSDDELPEHLDNLKIPPAAGLLLKDLAAHLGNEIDISLTHPSAGAQIRIIGNGLNLVVRNLAKYLEANDQ